MLTFENKVALITGAASRAGIGFAIARKLGLGGAKIVISDVRGDEIQLRADELGAGGCQVLGLAHDVTSEADWTRISRNLLDGFGKLDILVNNAGIAELKQMDVMTLADWNRHITVNLTSVFLGCQMALREMRLAGRGGAIINLSSISGQVGAKGTAAYAASKGGIRLLTKTIALEAAPDRIRVNSVHPGVIWTEMQSRAWGDNLHVFEAIRASIPMGHLGTPEDVASVVAFLASDESKYVTGSEFTVDGGYTAQ